ncbi:M64 family metallopeptidase [Longispora albida]|uniref:M64 family metallopeptidase n=1 Tax=Longispora albida TaxID=203523 RepID=UPI00039F69A3|nr:M64 family metallopeptidase [Longispora albida]
MRQGPIITRLTVAIAAMVTAVLATSSAHAVPRGEERVWREVFLPNGTITEMYLPAERPAAVRSRDLAAAATANVSALQDTGSVDSRFDLVFVGDGYTASELGTYRQHAQAKWNEIAATAPWSKYRSYVNVWLVEVISAQSGVDNDPTQGAARSTALDMYFWCGGTEHLLCLNEAKAQQYAAQAPAVDAIVAIGNSGKYGGAGYPSLSTASGANASSGQIAIHELGHSVGGLADEYFKTGTTYGGAEPAEPNVTRSPSGSKWGAYLGRPTPDGGVIGAFQGGYYHEHGIYRPSQDSLMRSLGKPFNSIGLDVMDRAIGSKISGGTQACAGYASARTGSLAAGGSAYQPDGTYYYATAAGQHRACLDGPPGTNLNVYLQKWSGSAWQTVASGTTTGPDETLSYQGTSGYYIFLIQAVSGSGAYTLAYTTP